MCSFVQAAHEGTTVTLLAKRKPPAPLLSVSLVNEDWLCDSPVDLASVTARMTPA